MLGRSSTDTGMWLVVSALCAGIAGCASGSKSSTIPSDGPTMTEIYRQHMSGIAQRAMPIEREPNAQHTREGLAKASLHERSVADEIEARFARLPNPDLVMYVTPHLSANGRYPVPGYSTVFPMYETVEYAMPGEVAWRPAPETRMPEAASAAASAVVRAGATPPAEPTR